MKYALLLIATFYSLALNGSVDLQTAIPNALVRYSDFPKKGIIYSDISPILEDSHLFTSVIDHLYERYRGKRIDAIAGLEARGFLFAAPLAYRLNVPLVMIRKAGKLPGDVHHASYSKIYGEDRLEMRKGALTKGQRVVVVDDFFSTGGTLNAARELIEAAGASIEEAAVLINNKQVHKKKTLPFGVYSLSSI